MSTHRKRTSSKAPPQAAVTGIKQGMKGWSRTKAAHAKADGQVRKGKKPGLALAGAKQGQRPLGKTRNGTKGKGSLKGVMI